MKVFVLFFLVSLFFVWQTYAQQDTSVTAITAELFALFINLASWIWIFLAILAGKFMTNDFMYGAFLHLDASLWTLWNVMKNFANFLLWFLVLFAIVKNVFSPFSKDWGKWAPIKVIKKTLIAWVLIQSSWFLFGAVVDVSTIMTTAISAFPSQFISQDSEFQGNIYKSLTNENFVKWKLVFNPTDKDAKTKRTYETWSQMTEDEMKELVDTITPNYDSVAGPLLYLWASVFNLTDSHNFKWDSWWDVFLDVWISAIMLFLFTFMLFLLFLFNFFRVMVLWIVIPLMPIIFVAQQFDMKLWEWFNDFLKIWNIFKLIFKPVLMVWTLSLILVFLVLIKSVISSGKTFEDENGNFQVISREWSSQIKSDWIFDFTMSDAKDGFADIVVFFFGLFMFFFLVKIAAKSGTWIKFIDERMKNVTEWISGIMSSLPIIPTPEWWIGVGSIWRIWWSSLWSNLWETLNDMAGIDLNEQRAALWLGPETRYSLNDLKPDLSSDDFIEIANSLLSSGTNTEGIKNKIVEWNETPPEKWGLKIDDWKVVFEKQPWTEYQWN